jgi:hypothetical protein
METSEGIYYISPRQHLENLKSPLTAKDHKRGVEAIDHTKVAQVAQTLRGEDLKVAPEEGSGKKLKKLVIPKKHF